MRNLGSTYIAIGELENARVSLQKSTDIFTSFFGTNNIKTICAYRELGRAYLYLGELKKANQVFKVCLNFYEANLKQHVHWIASTLPLLGETYLEGGDLQKGNYFLQKGINLLQSKSEGEKGGHYVYPILERASEYYKKRALDEEQKNNKNLAADFRKQALHYLELALNTARDRSPNSPPEKRLQKKLNKLRIYFQNSVL